MSSNPEERVQCFCSKNIIIERGSVQDPADEVIAQLRAQTAAGAKPSPTHEQMFSHLVAMEQDLGGANTDVALKTEKRPLTV
ncbi:hypothetical protein PG995_015676 [Apiospora arundinis]